MTVATVLILFNDTFRLTAPVQTSLQNEEVSRASGQHLFIASTHALAVFPSLALALFCYN